MRAYTPYNVTNCSEDRAQRIDNGNLFGYIVYDSSVLEATENI